MATLFVSLVFLYFSLVLLTTAHPAVASSHIEEKQMVNSEDLTSEGGKVSTPLPHVHPHDESHSMLNLMGLALVLGFVFMLLIDQFGKHSHASSSPVLGML